MVYFNGKLVPETEAKISVYDSALMFGDMVFEMTRSFGKKQFKLREHIDRLYAGVKILRIPLQMTPEEMEARSRPLNRGQRAKWERATKKKMGRPKIGAGSVAISPTREKGLLKRADAYAKSHGLKRAQFIAQALKTVMGESNAA